MAVRGQRVLGNAAVETAKAKRPVLPVVKQSSVIARLAVPVFAVAAIVCGVSGYRWFRDAEMRSHFVRAEAFVQQKKGPEAEAEWKAVLAADPKNVAAQELLAEYYLSRQEWKAAADAFARLETIAPTKPHLLCRRAAALLRVDDQKAAFELAEKEIAQDENCVAALGLVTTLMVQRPGIDQKRQLLFNRRLAKLMPDDLDIQRTYAETLSNQLKYDELRPVLDTILRLNPNDAQAYNLRGFADLASPDQPQGAKNAVTSFSQSLRIAPTNPGAHYGLGRAYLQLGQAKEAVGELEQAEKYLPGMARLYKELASAYRATGQKEKAAATQKRFLELQALAGEERLLIVRCVAYPEDVTYPRRLGILYLKIGDPTRAVYYLKQAKEKKPEDAEIASLLARAEAEAQQGAGRLGVPE